MTKVDDEERIAAARGAMVATIAAEVAETSHWLGKDRLGEAVMEAMARVPRHAFIPDNRQAVAYENRPQQIGHGQTISQPYIVAVMTDMAAPGPGRKILEVGTGCGYQAAVLAATGAKIYSIEVVPELARESAARLARLGYDTVEVRHGDGARGWPEEAPFDAIVVTAAAFRRVPPALLEQLAPGGRMIIPVERSASRFRLFGAAGEQELLLITKGEDGNVSERCMLPVAFVPLVEGRASKG
jgi:protein-L-isoaspartate(D-aspartate) O-methyltransferase